MWKHQRRRHAWLVLVWPEVARARGQPGRWVEGAVLLCAVVDELSSQMFATLHGRHLVLGVSIEHVPSGDRVLVRQSPSEMAPFVHNNSSCDQTEETVWARNFVCLYPTVLEHLSTRCYSCLTWFIDVILNVQLVDILSLTKQTNCFGNLNISTAKCSHCSRTTRIANKHFCSLCSGYLKSLLCSALITVFSEIQLILDPSIKKKTERIFLSLCISVF